MSLGVLRGGIRLRRQADPGAFSKLSSPSLHQDCSLASSFALAAARRIHIHLPRLTSYTSLESHTESRTKGTSSFSSRAFRNSFGMSSSIAGTVRTAVSSSRANMPWGGVTASSPAFTQLVVQSMRELFPEELADRSWDNVGLLLDNIETPENPHLGLPRVLLTNDLTYQVAEEAIAGGASVIISYHPIIFRPLKALTTSDPQQATLLLLASNRIAVYCPHTALDASPHGINAWLADNALYAAKQTPSPHEQIKCTARHVLRPVPDPSGKEPSPKDGPQTGYGVVATLNEEVPAVRVIKGLGRLLGGLRHLSVAEPVGCELAKARIRSLAVCAGSGSDVLRGCEAELWITGEMSHHDALAAAQRGKIVVTTYHSNTERRFLDFKLKGMLEDKLTAVDERAEVEVSRCDRDPFRTVEVENM